MFHDLIGLRVGQLWYPPFKDASSRASPDPTDSFLPNSYAFNSTLPKF